LSCLRKIAVLLCLVSPALAQQPSLQPPEPQCPAAELQSPAPPSSEQSSSASANSAGTQSGQSQDPKNDPKPQDQQKPNPDPKKPDDQVGKSKLEQETGTVNDRIFEVLPNYGTVETANSLPPLTSRQKFRIATASVFDWAASPFNGALAAISQAKNDPKEWGQGWARTANATALLLPTTASART